MNSTNTLSVSDLRQNTAEVIEAVVAKQQPMIILQRSKPKVVLVDVNYFEALEGSVLDLSDAKEAEKAKKEAKISLHTYVKKRWHKKSV